MRTALLNTLVRLQREEVPVDGDSAQTSEVMPPAPPREAPLHRGAVAKDGPMAQGRQLLGICPLASNTYVQHHRLQFQLRYTSSHLDNLSSHTLCSWGPSVGTASLHGILRR